MNYWRKRNKAFESLKSSQDQDPLQQITSFNNKYIILSNNGNNKSLMHHYIKKSNLDFEVIPHRKTLKKRIRTSEILLDKKVILLEKTGVAIAKLTQEEVEIFRKNDDLFLFPDKEMNVINTEASKNIENPDSEFITYGLKMANIKLESKIKGRGVKIAILDTGIDRNHPDLKNKIADGRSWVGDDENNFQDKNGHGTHCAGIVVGGVDPKGKRYGVAPNALLYIGKVVDQNGTGILSNLLQAVDWAIEKNCDIISISLSSKLYELPDIIQADILKKANDKGIVIVAAAGNNSNHEANVLNLISNPAAAKDVRSIGAIDNHYRIYNRSNIGNIPDLHLDYVAPGVDIYSSWLSENGKPKYKYLTGTSMATPLVAGVLALIISRYNGSKKKNKNKERIGREKLNNIINDNLFVKKKNSDTDPDEDWRDFRNKYGNGLPLAPND